MNHQPIRYWEIDALRGIGLFFMTVFHAVAIEDEIFGVNLCPYPWLREYFNLLSSLFLLIVGLSLYLGSASGKYPHWLSAAKRSGMILGIGVLITLGTYVLSLERKVYFGVLHCIGVCSFAGYFLLPLPKYALLIISLPIIVIGTYYEITYPYCYHTSLFWLYPCRCPELGWVLDCHPLIPHFGWVLFGTFLGKQLYPNGQASFSLPSTWCRIPPVSWACCLGRYSLLAYLGHLPLVFIVLYLMNKFIFKT